MNPAIGWLAIQGLQLLPDIARAIERRELVSVSGTPAGLDLLEVCDRLGLGLCGCCGRPACRCPRARWLRLDRGQLQAAASGLVEAGALPSFEAVPGVLYRARLKMTGLAQLASRGRVQDEFKKQNFAEVQAFDDARQLPADWPASERGEARGGSTWWVQGRYQGTRRQFDPAFAEGEGVYFLWIAPVDEGRPASSPPAPAAPPAPPVYGPPPAAPPTDAPGASRDRWAQTILTQAAPAAPTPSERIFWGAVGRLESNYGATNKGHNWGNIHARPNPDGSCPVGTYPGTDSHGDGSKYSTCFRAYPSDLEGAAALIEQLTTRRPKVAALVKAGASLRAIAEQMRQAPIYFEASAEVYAAALDKNARAICAATGDPWPFDPAHTSPAPAPAAEGGGGAGAVAVVGALVLGGLLLRR